MLQQAPELDFPEDTKPPIESILGRLASKMSPKWRHGILQLEVGLLLRTWSRGKGNVLTELRVYLLDDAGPISSLVPDVAFVSFERVPKNTPFELRERPTIAPDLVVEILSPGERKRRIEEKVALYLEHGSVAVLIVDPDRRTTERIAADGRVTYGNGETLVDPSFAGLTIDVDQLFAAID
jgi:Uma2 family endonuclease